MRNDEFCNIFSNQQQEAHSNRARFQYNVSYIIDCFNKNEPESMIEANKNDIKNIEMSEKAKFMLFMINMQMKMRDLKETAKIFRRKICKKIISSHHHHCD